MNSFFLSPQDYNHADIIIIGYPYDATASFKPGSRFAPNAIRDNYSAVESYSPYLDTDIASLKICDLQNLVFDYQYDPLEQIYNKTKSILKNNKFIVSLGGEHLISYPILKAFKKKFNNILFVHFDAHADLRHQFLGLTLSHATVIRRVFDLLGDNKIFQLGFRSGTKEEFDFSRKHCFSFPFNLKQTSSVIKAIDTHTPLYISIDLDILDPSILPGTGTPEPGGVTYYELVRSLALFKNNNIVGIDIVELAPHYDHSGVSTIVATSLLRECLALLNK